MSDFFEDESGISPLIAAVLLIAFTMTVAAILATWAQTFGRERLKSAGERGTKAIECSNLQISVSGASWKNDRIQAIVWNRAKDNITNFELVVYNKTNSTVPNVYKPSNYNETIGASEFINLKVSGINKEPQKLEINAMGESCPDYQPLYTCKYSDGELTC